MFSVQCSVFSVQCHSTYAREWIPWNNWKKEKKMKQNKNRKKKKK